MAEIPVWSIIRATYKYLADNFGEVFGLIWFAALVDVAATTLDPDRLAVFQGLSEPEKVGVSVGVYILDALVYSVAAVALTRKILGTRLRRSYFYFAFGSTERQMLLASLGCWAGMIAATTLTLIVFVVLDFLFARLVPVPDWVFGGIAIFVIIGLWTFAMIRYLFFLPLAAALAPNRRLDRSYNMSAGNFWRILVIVAVVLSPIIAFAIVLPAPTVFVAWHEGILHWPSSLQDFDIMMEAIAQRVPAWWYFPSLALDFASTIFVWAGTVSAAVFCYRALVPGTSAA